LRCHHLGLLVDTLSELSRCDAVLEFSDLDRLDAGSASLCELDYARDLSGSPLGEAFEDLG
jgi:hypothetical protein